MIYLEENTKRSRDMQQRLNPNMKEAVKNEVIKLIDCRNRHRGGPKNISKRTDFWHPVLLEKISCLRSRHLVLWSLGTLTGQQRFYGSELVT